MRHFKNAVVLVIAFSALALSQEVPVVTTGPADEGYPKEMESNGGYSNGEGVASRRPSQYPMSTICTDMVVREIIGKLDDGATPTNYVVRESRVDATMVWKVTDEWLEEFKNMNVTRLWLKRETGQEFMWVEGPSEDVRGQWGYARRAGVVNATYKFK